jgi:hypothetical protein
MFIAEKFLCDKIGKINFPIPEQNGYVGYEINNKNKDYVSMICLMNIKSNYFDFSTKF